MCPTPVGRIHTRVATIVLPAILGILISLLTGNAAWIVLIGLYLLQGVALDAAVYSWLLRYQPPWMTGVLAVAELGLLLVLANAVELGISIPGAIVFYWVSWLLVVFTKIVLLPIFSLTYLESSQEFRSASWSIPPSQANVPVVASAGEAQAGPGQVIEGASGVHRAPLDPRPSPSGLHPVPPDLPLT